MQNKTKQQEKQRFDLCDSHVSSQQFVHISEPPSLCKKTHLNPWEGKTVGWSGILILQERSSNQVILETKITIYEPSIDFVFIEGSTCVFCDRHFETLITLSIRYLLQGLCSSKS